VRPERIRSAFFDLTTSLSFAIPKSRSASHRWRCIGLFPVAAVFHFVPLSGVADGWKVTALPRGNRPGHANALPIMDLQFPDA